MWEDTNVSEGPAASIFTLTRRHTKTYEGIEVDKIQLKKMIHMGRDGKTL
jgi:hypothetical protein